MFITLPLVETRLNKKNTYDVVSEGKSIVLNSDYIVWIQDVDYTCDEPCCVVGVSCSNKTYHTVGMSAEELMKKLP